MRHGSNADSQTALRAGLDRTWGLPTAMMAQLALWGLQLCRRHRAARHFWAGSGPDGVAGGRARIDSSATFGSGPTQAVLRTGLGGNLCGCHLKQRHRPGSITVGFAHVTTCADV